MKLSNLIILTFCLVFCSSQAFSQWQVELGSNGYYSPGGEEILTYVLFTSSGYYEPNTEYDYRSVNGNLANGWAIQTAVNYSVSKHFAIRTVINLRNSLSSEEVISGSSYSSPGPTYSGSKLETNTLSLRAFEIMLGPKLAFALGKNELFFAPVAGITSARHLWYAEFESRWHEPESRSYHSRNKPDFVGQVQLGYNQRILSWLDLGFSGLYSVFHLSNSNRMDEELLEALGAGAYYNENNWKQAVGINISVVFNFSSADS